MTKIYTKTGDKGETGLFGGNRISKASLRVEAIGTVDELNSTLGLVLAEITNYPADSFQSGFRTNEIRRDKLLITNYLERVQNDLFEIGAMLATPRDTKVTKGQNIHKTLPAYLEKRTRELEALIDTLTKELAPMTTFILPGGSVPGAQLHVARTIARRAERRIVELNKKEPVADELMQYVNRLSDLLFTMARYVNMKEKKKETNWEKV